MKTSISSSETSVGDSDFNSIDSLDFQPRTGNLYVIEDHPNGDIFACLRDGNTNVPTVDDYGTGDVLKITGFELPK